MTRAHETAAEPPERSVLQIGTGLPRAVAVLLGAASAVVVAAGLHAVAWLVGPLFLALVIVITVYPVQTWLRRVGVPGWAATTLLVLLVYAVLIVLTATIVISIAQLATLLPAYAVDANALVNRLSSLLAQVGVGNVQLAAIASSLSIGKLVTIVTSLLLGLTGLIGNAVFLLSLLLFLSIDAPGIEPRLGLLSHSNAGMATALDGFARATRRYISVNTTFGALTGAVDMIVLWAIGVPLAPLWGCWSSSPPTSRISVSGSVSDRPPCSPSSSGVGRCCCRWSVSSWS